MCVYSTSFKRKHFQSNKKNCLDKNIQSYKYI